MKCVERLEKYKEDDFDRIMLLIRNGTIKCGKYSHLVKVNENKLMKGKEFFNDERSDDN